METDVPDWSETQWGRPEMARELSPKRLRRVGIDLDRVPSWVVAGTGS